MKTENLLRFGEPNAKLKALAKLKNFTLKTFSLPSGWTCPGAKECLSKADRATGKIKDGKDTEFRCFQASAEALYPSLRKMVWRNFDLIKEALLSAWRYKKDKVQTVANLICDSLPKKFDILRVHVGGDDLRCALGHQQQVFDVVEESLRVDGRRLHVEDHPRFELGLVSSGDYGVFMQLYSDAVTDYSTG